MKFQFLNAAAVLVSMSFASCSVSITRIVEEPVSAGMTSEELVASYGVPLEVERHPDGTQDWTYRFASSEHVMGSKPAGWEEDRYGAGEGASKSITLGKAQLRLSPDMKVVGEIPEGRIVRRK